MGRGLWDDSNSGHMLMVPNTPGTGALYAMGSGHLCPPQPTPAALLSSFPKCPLRAVEDKQGGKEREKRHATNQQSKSISRETLLGISCKAQRQHESRAPSHSSHQSSAFLLASAISSAALAAPESSQTAHPKDLPPAPSGADSPAATRGATRWDQNMILIPPRLGKAERGLCFLSCLSRGYIHTQDKRGR